MDNILRKHKSQYIIFVFIAFIIPWMFVPILSAKSNLNALHPFGYYIMILPATGIVAGQIFVNKKVAHVKQWIYLLAFFSLTVLVFLWGIGKMKYETIMAVMTILLAVFSVALFLSCCLGTKKETPAYQGKGVLFALGIFILIELIVMFIPDFQLNLLPKTIATFIFTMMNTILSSSIMIYGEEYAWRGHLLGKFQRVFGKRIGVILLGFVWEVWHLPYWIIIFRSGMFSETIGYSFWIFLLLRILNTVSMSIILGWAYTKTENLWCCVLIHGINNGLTGSAAVSPMMDTIPLITLVRPTILSLFLFTKEYRKKQSNGEV